MWSVSPQGALLNPAVTSERTPAAPLDGRGEREHAHDVSRTTRVRDPSSPERSHRRDQSQDERARRPLRTHRPGSSGAGPARPGLAATGTTAQRRLAGTADRTTGLAA